MHFLKKVPLVVLALSLITTAACTAESAVDETDPTSVVSEAEAREMMTTALEGFNAEDYQAWSRDWSAEMKSAITKEVFRDFLANTKPTTGAYVAIEDLELIPGEVSGYVRWQASVRFEESDIRFGFGMKPSERTVYGVFFDPE